MMANDSIQIEHLNYVNWCKNCTNENDICMKDMKEAFIGFFGILKHYIKKPLDHAMLVDILMQNAVSSLYTLEALNDARYDFSNFHENLLPKDFQYMAIPEIWAAINGEFDWEEETFDFAYESLWKWGNYLHKFEGCSKNDSKLFKQYYVSTEECEELSAIIKTVLKDEEFMAAFLKNAIQPTGNLTDKSGYIFIPFCKYQTYSDKMNLEYCNLFKQQYIMPEAHNCFTFNGNASNPLHNENVGPEKGLTFVLDFTLLTPDTRKSDPAMMILHEPGSPPDTTHFKSSFIQIHPGVDLRYGMNAIITDTTEDFNLMDIKKRNCQHKEDPPIIDIIYDGKSFDKVSCVLSKMVIAAMKKCGCHPWYLNLTNMSINNICEGIGIACYKQFLTNAKKTGEYKKMCLPACQSTKYAPFLSIRRQIYDIPPLDPLRATITRYFKDDVSRVVNLLRVNDTLESYEKFRWSQISVININFEDPEASVVTKDAKVTFSDMLGTIGGTFGIFLGLSFVGLVEIMIDTYGKLQLVVRSGRP
jgi:hypothetical protein